MRSRLLAVVGVVVAAAITVGAGGYSSVGTDRGVTVTTADDEDAYLSLQFSNKTVTRNSGEAATFVTVENRLTESVDITVTYIVDGSSTEQSDSETGVNPGDSFDATFTCDSGGEHIVSFDATATGSSVSVRTERTRTVAVTCAAPTTTG